MTYDTRRKQARKQERMADNRAYVNRLKCGPCVDCGQAFHPAAMDWHHRDPSLKYRAVSKLVAYGCSLDVIDAEIAKCDLICANCHRIRTHVGRD